MIPGRRAATVQFIMGLRQRERRRRSDFHSSAWLDRAEAASVAACLLLLFTSLGCREPSSTPPGPVRRIILVSLDTLRPDHLGIHGYSRDTSPRIDGFAASSFVFERALAPAPNTPPSQMSMMTSLYPARHGFTGLADRLAPGIETLAERLRAEGLETAGFVDGGYLSRAFGFDRGFATYDDQGGGLAGILPRALEWLDERSDEPFFLFLHAYDIHAPYVSPAPYAGMFHATPYDGDVVPSVERLEVLFRNRVRLPPKDLQHLVDSYDEGIRYTDSQLGRLFDHLESLGRLDDTLVIVTSDHGEEFDEHGSLIHWQLYFQPNLRVPLIIRPPGGVAGPVRVREQAELIDILPTLLDLGGAPPLEAAQGRSLADVMHAALDGGAGPPRSEEIDRAAFGWWPDPEQLPIRSLVLDDYQLIFNDYAPGGDELYDIGADPMTQRNLASERPELVERLRLLGRQGMEASRPIDGAKPDTDLILDADTLEELKALGYER
jgi:arylsulfatase A-like enzyme